LIKPELISMSLWKIAGASLALACAGAPQDPAPDVLLLARIKSHMREELSHTPNYTCLETISRFRKDPGSHPEAHAKLTSLDTVRLEIVHSNHQEWYGSPGDRILNVDNRHIHWRRNDRQRRICVDAEQHPRFSNSSPKIRSRTPQEITWCTKPLL
jgi:hypothetical protein